MWCWAIAVDRHVENSAVQPHFAITFRPQSFGEGPGPLQLGAQPFVNSLAGPGSGAQPSGAADHGSLWQTQQPAPTNLTVRLGCASCLTNFFI